LSRECDDEAFLRPVTAFLDILDDADDLAADIHPKPSSQMGHSRLASIQRITPVGST
jgi:hypothetical protein